MTQGGGPVPVGPPGDGPRPFDPPRTGITPGPVVPAPLPRDDTGHVWLRRAALDPLYRKPTFGDELAVSSAFPRSEPWELIDDGSPSRYRPPILDPFGDPIGPADPWDLTDANRPPEGNGNRREISIQEVMQRAPEKIDPRAETAEEDDKPEDQKPEDQKPEDQKPEDKKPEDKKPEDKKPEDKKPEDKPKEKNASDPTLKPGDVLEGGRFRVLKVVGDVVYVVEIGTPEVGVPGDGRRPLVPSSSPSDPAPKQPSDRGGKPPLDGPDGPQPTAAGDPIPDPGLGPSGRPQDKSAGTGLTPPQSDNTKPKPNGKPRDASKRPARQPPASAGPSSHDKESGTKRTPEGDAGRRKRSELSPGEIGSSRTAPTGTWTRTRTWRRPDGSTVEEEERGTTIDGHRVRTGVSRRIYDKSGRLRGQRDSGSKPEDKSGPQRVFEAFGTMWHFVQDLFIDPDERRRRSEEEFDEMPTIGGPRW